VGQSDIISLILLTSISSRLGIRGVVNKRARGMLLRCPQCRTVVLPMSDGRCPSCQAKIGVDAFEPVEANYEEAAKRAMECEQKRLDKSRRGSGAKEILAGLFLVIVGAAIVAGTYAAASSMPRGGAYLIWYGPIVVGLTMIYRGISKR